MYEVAQILGSTHPLIGFKYMILHIHNMVVLGSTTKGSSVRHRKWRSKDMLTEPLFTNIGLDYW
jgi:hypothetical protein